MRTSSSHVGAVAVAPQPYCSISNPNEPAGRRHGVIATWRGVGSRARGVYGLNVCHLTDVDRGLDGLGADGEELTGERRDLEAFARAHAVFMGLEAVDLWVRAARDLLAATAHGPSLFLV